MRCISMLIFLLLLWACESKSSPPPEESPIVSIPVDPIPAPEPFDTVGIKYVMGKFDPADETDYVRIEHQYSAGSGRGAYLHEEAYAAFVEMAQAARAEGVILTIISATRNFDRQRAIWEAKWKGQRLVGGKNLARTVADPVERARIILRYSSMPGTSRHHWGTDFDLNNLNNSYFEAGKGKAEYEWLVAHAGAFGFGQPYSKKGADRPSGYEEEKWHWSYLPVAKRFHRSYQVLVDESMLTGFAGAEAAEPMEVIRHYVNGIAPECLPEN